MAPEYRAAVIGCGGMSHGHASQYHRLDNVELVACADIKEEALQSYRDRYGVQNTYTDYEEMLAAERPDLVSVCTWIALHAPATVACARAGVQGVICEKPMATSLSLADEMISACDAAGTKLAIGHQLRFDGPYVTAKRLLAEGAIGEVRRVHGLCEGGDLMDNATHTVDLVRWFADDPPTEWIMGQINRGGAGMKYGIPSLRDALGYWKCENGVRCHIESGAISARGYHHFFLYGTAGEMEIGVPGGPSLRYRSEATDGRWSAPDVRGDSAPVRDLLRAIEEDGEHRCSGRTGRAALEVLLGIMVSSRRRALVTCPFGAATYPLQDMIDAGEA
jgi:predicted dehydrogenase